MLATDTYVEVLVSGFTKLESHIHKLTNTILVESCERIVLEDLCIVVSVEELTCVVTRESECHLSKVVSTEAEEVSILSDLVRDVSNWAE